MTMVLGKTINHILYVITAVTSLPHGDGNGEENTSHIARVVTVITSLSHGDGTGEEN